MTDSTLIAVFAEEKQKMRDEIDALKSRLESAERVVEAVRSFLHKKGYTGHDGTANPGLYSLWDALAAHTKTQGESK